MAIDLENRYRGIRSPHKIKGGVSGCVRECAEAQVRLYLPPQSVEKLLTLSSVVEGFRTDRNRQGLEHLRRR